MAANYDILAQRPDTEWLGGGQTRQVMAVGIVTKPSGVYMEFRVAKPDYTPAVVRQDANGFAIVIEQLFDIPGVIGVQWSQVPGASGQLADVLDITVQSDSETATDTFTVPFAKLTQDYVAAQAAKAIDTLNAIQGS